MPWMLKSESDLDRVFVEVDDDGHETGETVYLWHNGEAQQLTAEGVQPLDDVPFDPDTAERMAPPVLPPAVPFDWHVMEHALLAADEPPVVEVPVAEFTPPDLHEPVFWYEPTPPEAFRPSFALCLGIFLAMLWPVLVVLLFHTLGV